MIIVFFGDSLIASAFPPATIPWPVLIQQAATAAGRSDVMIVNLAKNSQNSNWGIANVASVIAAKPDILIFDFIMNDAGEVFPGTPSLTAAQSAANTEAIIAAVRSALPNCTIFLMTPSAPPANMARYFLTGAVDAYSQQYRIIAQQQNVGLIDNYPVWQNAVQINPNVAGSSGIVGAQNGVHPSDWADVLYEVPGVMAATGLNFPVLGDPADVQQAIAVPGAYADIALLYWGALNVMPDMPGLNYWIAQQKTSGFASVAAALEPFMESAWNGGTAPAIPMTPTQVLTWCSINALGRLPTSNEIAVWTGNGLTNTQIMVGISTGPEAMTKAKSRRLATW